jgi:hypothetical protein
MSVFGFQFLQCPGEFRRLAGMSFSQCKNLGNLVRVRDAKEGGREPKRFLSRRFGRTSGRIRLIFDRIIELHRYNLA